MAKVTGEVIKYDDHLVYTEEYLHKLHEQLSDPMDLLDFDSFIKGLRMYVLVHKMIQSNFPTMSMLLKVDMIVNYIMRPRFFDEDLVSRIRMTFSIGPSHLN
jgi:hypothetical protein